MEPAWEEVRNLVTRPAAETLAAYEFAFDSPYVKAHANLRDFALPRSQGSAATRSDRPLTKRIYTQFKHDPTATQNVHAARRGASLAPRCLPRFFAPRDGLSSFAGLPAAICRRSTPRQTAAGQGPTPRHAWVSTYFPNIG